LGQNFSGSYAMRLPNGGAITISLNQDQAGHATGTMTGNGSSFPIDARIQNGNLVGKAGAVYFEAALEGNKIEVVMSDFPSGGQTNQLERRGTGGSGPSLSAGPSGATAPAGQPGTDQASQQLTQLLTSSSWCSFSYSATSGSSNTSKSTFRPDGILVIGTGH